ncbi:MAG: nitroreductase family protein [Bacteroidales bacterium]|nr:nitroreductase family protein [Bacteroidales bacterium]
MKSDFLEILHERKSVRQYSDQKVTEEQLETLVRAGMAAPSAVNRQPWFFFAINDRVLLDELGNRLPYAKMLLQAPAAIVVCGNMERALDAWQQEFWIQDCSAATQNILLAAGSMGLGSVWTAVYPATDRIEIVRKVLILPSHLIPLNVLPIGYPDGPQRAKDKWKPENMMWNKWQ